MIELKIKAVGMDINSMSPVVILTDVKEENFMPIYIGLPEAQSIAMRIQQTSAPRPLTHDLMINILKELDIVIKNVSIIDLHDGVYYANIELFTDGKVYNIDARPSDAIALAIRTNSPIFVEEKVAQEAFISSQNTQKENEEDQEFRQFLDNLKLDDLDKYL
jgi:hypothetical protein